MELRVDVIRPPGCGLFVVQPRPDLSGGVDRSDRKRFWGVPRVAEMGRSVTPERFDIVLP